MKAATKIVVVSFFIACLVMIWACILAFVFWNFSYLLFAYHLFWITALLMISYLIIGGIIVYVKKERENK